MMQKLENVSQRVMRGDSMAVNDSDIHRNPIHTADKLKNKVRQHSVRVSQNATDSPIERPKDFRNRNFGKGGI